MNKFELYWKIHKAIPGKKQWGKKWPEIIRTQVYQSLSHYSYFRVQWYTVKDHTCPNRKRSTHHSYKAADSLRTNKCSVNK